MQTFRAPSDDNTNTPPPASEVQHQQIKDDYRPFVPEEISSTPPAEPQAPEPMGHTPEEPQMPPPTIEPQQAVAVAPSAQPTGDVYYYQPEHVYYPPTAEQFREDHAGMDRRRFRSLVIGFLLLALAGFLVIIILFGMRGSHQLYQQTQNIADVTIFTPKFEEVVAPPFQVVGEARDYWFDDNQSFPVIVYDDTDVPVMHGFAIAQDTSRGDYYSFQAILEGYNVIPQKKRGYIALTRPDDIDGTPTYTIPIEFKKQGRNFVAGSRPGDTMTGTGENASGAGSNTGAGGGAGSSGGNSGGSSGSSSGPIAVSTCGNGIDDDSDGLYDINDPECHSDFNALNFRSYVTGNRELDPTNSSPNPGSGGSGNSGGSNTGSTGSSNFTGTHPGDVMLYFANVNDNPFDPSCDKLFTRNRSLESGPSGEVARRALESLILGPTPVEAAQGYTAGVKRGLDISSFSLANGTLTIDFVQSNIVADSDLCSRADVVEHITKTMMQFPDVERVVVN